MWRKYVNRKLKFCCFLKFDLIAYKRSSRSRGQFLRLRLRKLALKVYFEIFKDEELFTTIKN
jgi:hypothetical protein